MPPVVPAPLIHQLALREAVQLGERLAQSVVLRSGRLVLRLVVLVPHSAGVVLRLVVLVLHSAVHSVAHSVAHSLVHSVVHSVR